jgi:hypothetical protein
LVLAMRKRKERQIPSSTATWGDRWKVVAGVLSSAFNALRIGAWIWSHWPF